MTLIGDSSAATFPRRLELEASGWTIVLRALEERDLEAVVTIHRDARTNRRNAADPITSPEALQPCQSYPGRRMGCPAPYDQSPG